MIGTRDREYSDREWTDDRWHKAVGDKGGAVRSSKWRGMSGGISQNSGGIITDKAV